MSIFDNGTFDAMLKRKYDIMQQGADTDQFNADTSRMGVPIDRMNAQTNRFNADTTRMKAPSEIAQNYGSARNLNASAISTEQMNDTLMGDMMDYFFEQSGYGTGGAGVGRGNGMTDTNLSFGSGVGAGLGSAVAENDVRRYYAKGVARVPGKGSGKVDTVKAKLAPGEAVLNKAAADKMGRGLIAAMNQIGARKMGLV